MKTLIASSIIFLLCSFINAQVTQQWAMTFNGSGNSNDEFSSMVRDNQNNIIVTGRVNSTGNNANFGTVKYNSAGVLQWSAIFNGGANGYDQANALVVDNSGNVYVSGQVRDSSLYYNIALVKYNASGVQQWVRYWSGSSGKSDVPEDMAIDNAGNIFITGTTEGTSRTSYVTLKFDVSGNFYWARTYSYASNTDAYAYFIRTDNQGNCYVTGTSDAPVSGSDFLTIKYNSNGDSSWTARYSGTTLTNEIPQGFEVDNSGNVYVTGFTNDTGSGIDYMTIKYNTSGIQQWATRYSSPGNAQDIPEDLEIDADGNVYVTGRTRVSGSYNDFGTVKYNSSGVQQWLAVFDNPSYNRDDDPHELSVDNSGNVYVTGYTNIGSNGNAVTLKYDNFGNQKWVIYYSGGNASESFAVEIDTDNNVYIAGNSMNPNEDYLIVKYSQTIGIHQISSEVPNTFSLHQNYPNPFNPETKIKFDIMSDFRGQTSDVKLTVYNTLGEEINVLLNNELVPGSYEVTFDGNNLTSGVYFYKLEVNNFAETRRMLLIR